MLVTENNFSTIFQYLKTQNFLVLDTETTGLLPYNGSRLVGIAIADHKGEAWYFSFRHSADNLPITLLPILIEELSNSGRTLLFHNAKFDLQILYQDGFKLNGPIEDTLLLAHLMNENEESHGLKQLGVQYIDPQAGEADLKLQQLLMAKKVSKDSIHLLTGAETEPYACQDVCLTLKLRNFYVPHAKTWKLYDLWQEMNAFEVIITNMEHRGVQLNMDLVEEYFKLADVKSGELEKKIKELAKRDINPRSPIQLQAWLGIDSTNAKFLEEIASDREDISALQQYRTWLKMKNTYYQAFKELVDQDKALHCSYRMTGTISGRLSCSRPNLQAIPRQAEKVTPLTEAKTMVKNVFTARPGFTLVECDYSQAELRMAAHFANETTMKEIFISGEDLHSATARKVGCERFVAKTLNFAILYGVGPKKLSTMLKTTVEKAKEYYDGYFKTFPKLLEFNEKLQISAAYKNYIRLPTGRVRHVPLGEAHKSLNNLCQGSVSEMVRLAMMRIDREVKDVHMLLNVHDAIIFEVPTDNLFPKIKEILEIMQDTPYTVKMIADAKYGQSWGTMLKYKGHDA